MTDRPRVIMLMESSLDGRLHPSRWTASPDGTTKDWSGSYEAIHERLGADAWLVGRATMAEMAKSEAHPPRSFDRPPRPRHLARGEGPFAIAVDRSGKLHFAGPDIGGDPVVVLLGRDVSDAHLAELAGDGISYLVAEDTGEDGGLALAPLLAALRRDLGIATLLLEGGGRINGSFLAAGLVDEMHVVLAPALDGSPSPAIVESGEEGLKGKVTLSFLGCEQLGNGALHLRYAVATA